MPKTDFEMRGKLPTKEPAYVERWQNANMYEKVIKQNEGKEHFIFHDGPPYANGNMHVGHMLNMDVCSLQMFQHGYTAASDVLHVLMHRHNIFL